MVININRLMESVRERELNSLEQQLSAVRNHWQTVRTDQHQHVSFLEQQRKKHSQEADQFLDFQDFLRPSLLERKLRMQLKAFSKETQTSELSLQTLKEHLQSLQMQKAQQQAML